MVCSTDRLPAAIVTRNVASSSAVLATSRSTLTANVALLPADISSIGVPGYQSEGPSTNSVALPASGAVTATSNVGRLSVPPLRLTLSTASTPGCGGPGTSMRASAIALAATASGLPGGTNSRASTWSGMHTVSQTPRSTLTARSTADFGSVTTAVTGNTTRSV